MIEILLAALLMAFDGGGSEFARTSDSRIDHGFLGSGVGQDQNEVDDGLSDPEPVRPAIPTCTPGSAGCTAQWDEYSEKFREYQRQKDAWCARRGGGPLICKFQF